jgi:hypothetical protein
MTLRARGTAPLPKKRLVVKDKFYKKKDWAFLDARNARCALAARLLDGCSCVFLDSPKLGTSRALLQAGVPACRVFPVNGRDEGGFSRKAQQLGLQPVVSMFHAAATESQALQGRRDVAVCYNDGTHGDPDLVWRDMSPWLRRLPRKAYVSYTFAIRSRNAVPATASFGILLMLARRGFCPPGGWQRLREAFTFDGRMFNVQLLRGLERGSRASELASLAEENGYSLGERYLKAPRKEAAARSPSELKRLVRELSLRRKEVKSKDREPFLKRWQKVRTSIALLGPKGEKEVLCQLPRASWVRQQYRKWLSSSSGRHSKDLVRRFPHRRKEAEAAHWQKAARWVSQALQQLPSKGRLLVSAEAHPHFPSYLDWLRGFVSELRLRRTLCVREGSLAPGIKANVTRRRSFPLRTEQSLEQLREAGSRLLPRGKGARFDAALLPLLTVSSYEAALEQTERLISEALSEKCVLVLHVRSGEALCTLAWAVNLIGRLAAFRFRLADCCELAEDGSELMDYSRILTLVLSRGL